MFMQDFMKCKPVMPEAHLSFAEVLEKVKDAEHVTFVERLCLCEKNSYHKLATKKAYLMQRILPLFGLDKSISFQHLSPNTCKSVYKSRSTPESMSPHDAPAIKSKESKDSLTWPQAPR